MKMLNDNLFLYLQILYVRQGYYFLACNTW